MKKLTMNEQIFLIAIWHLEDGAYGVKIREKIIDVTEQDMMFGTIYNTLDKLVKKGYVVTRKSGAATEERGGYKKVFYTLTPEGREALRKARELQDTLWANIPSGVF
ncbi:PadR family transcriptional regulator [bacterium]|nr:PadR family transcriptional regulator [bacterium]